MSTPSTVPGREALRATGTYHDDEEQRSVDRWAKSVHKTTAESACDGRKKRLRRCGEWDE